MADFYILFWMAGSNSVALILSVVLYIRQELRRVHQPFRSDPAQEQKIGLRNSPEAAPKPDSPVFSPFSPEFSKMQEKTSLVLVDKKGSFHGAHYWI